MNKLRVRYQREQDEKEKKRKLELIKEEYIRNQKIENETMDQFESAEAAFKEMYKKPKTIEIISIKAKTGIVKLINKIQGMKFKI